MSDFWRGVVQVHPFDQLGHQSPELETNSPGAFDVTAFDSADEAADAIRNREVIGGIAATPDGVIVQKATGAGVPYARLLQNLGTGLAASGQQVTYDELVPDAAPVSSRRTWRTARCW